MQKIAIITLNINGKKDTIELLDSLKKLRTANCQLLTVVVDNASVDGSVSEIHRRFPDVDILQTGANLGFAGGFNKGIEYAKVWGAEYFLIINNDTLVGDENLILALLETSQSSEKIGIVSPKIYFAPGFEFHKDRYSKEDLGKIIWYGGGEFDWDNISAVHKGIDEVDSGQCNNSGEVGFISGACMFIKASVFEKIDPPHQLAGGGFDERYFLYFEDADFQKRVKEAGFKLYYNSNVFIYHKVSRSTGIGSQITDYYHARNRLMFGIQYASFRTKFALIRESFKFLIFGRNAQRKGVLDFYLGITGRMEGIIEQKRIEYPLKLSIGIVNYNTPDLTRKLLESIFKKTSGFNPEIMEVIVLDNGDVDACKESIRGYLPKIKYLKNKVNEGFSKGYNKTIRYSLGEYYLMLNSDIEVLEGGLSELIKAEDSMNGEAVLGGKLVFPNQSPQDSVFNLPTITGAFNQYFLNKKGAYFMFQPKGGTSVRVEGLVMACFMIPRKVLTRAGLLDEGTFIFFEDIEYCRRLKKLGIPVYYVPSAKFIHHHGASTKKIGNEQAVAHLIKSSKRYHGAFYYLFLTWVLKLGQKFGIAKTPSSIWTE
jgi:GT2 family glycosyltransferase